MHLYQLFLLLFKYIKKIYFYSSRNKRDGEGRERELYINMGVQLKIEDFSFDSENLII